MDGQKEFSALLRECRENAKFNQKELGREIGYPDGTMISKWERRRKPGYEPIIPPSPKLQLIIDVFARRNVPRGLLDELWKAAAAGSAKPLDSTLEPIVSVIFDEFQNLKSEEGKKLLVQDLRSVVQMDLGYFSAKSANRERRWVISAKNLSDLRGQIAQFVQNFYLRIDDELGYSLYSQGNYSEANEHFLSALSAARDLKYEIREADLLVKLGDTQRRIGGPGWETARNYYRQAKRIYSKEDHIEEKSDCARRIAAIYLFQGRPDKALRLLKRIEETCQEMRDDRGLYKTLQHEAWAYDLIGNWAEATRMNETAVTLVKSLGEDEWELAKALRYRADSYRIQRRAKEAEIDYLEALGILAEFESKGVSTQLLSGMIKLGLSKVYLRVSGREGEAQKYLNESLEVHKDLGEDFRIAQVLAEQADLLLHLNRFDLAETRLQDAINRFKRLDAQYYYVLALSTLSELYFKWGKFNEVHKTASIAANVKYKFLDYQVARTNFIVGLAYIAQRDFAAAAEAFYKASYRAVEFNQETYDEIKNEIIAEIDRVARAVEPDAALKILNLYSGYLESAGQEIAGKFPLQQLFVELGKEEKKIQTLRPVSDPGHLQ